MQTPSETLTIVKVEGGSAPQEQAAAPLPAGKAEAGHSEGQLVAHNARVCGVLALVFLVVVLGVGVGMGLRPV